MAATHSFQTLQLTSHLQPMCAEDVHRRLSSLCSECNKTFNIPSENQNKEPRNLDENGEPNFDIISGLFAMDLGHIILKIFSHLNGWDVANLVAANPTWATIVTSNRHIEQFISEDGDYASLKTLYRRRKLTSEASEIYQDVRAVFEQACKDFTKLDKFRVRCGQSCGEFAVFYPFSCFNLCFKDAYIGSEHLATIHVVCGGYLIQLYERWTLKLLKAIRVQGFANLKLHFISSSVLIQFNSSDEKRAVIWNQAMDNKVCTFTNRDFSRIFCVSQLIILLKKDRNHWFASVYKWSNGICSSPDPIVDEEPLQMLIGRKKALPNVVNSDENQDIFGILGHPTEHEPTSYVYQLRSKQDFSLRAIFFDDSHQSLLRHTTFLLDDRFVFANDGGRSIDVIALLDGKVRKVYTFIKPKEVCITLMCAKDISVVGEFLILQDASSSYNEIMGHSAAIWKLPSNFIETCLQHFKAGTVGSTAQCDQIVGKTDAASLVEFSRFFMKVDHQGVMKIRIDDENPSVMHVMMLNNIILDE